MNTLNTILFSAPFIPALISGSLHTDTDDTAIADLGYPLDLPIHTPTTNYKNPLHNPATYQDKSLTTLKALLAKKAYGVNEEDEDNHPPLAKALVAHNIGAIELLLQNGANPNTVISGRPPTTPLVFSIKHGTTEMMAVLLKNGARQNQSDLLFELFDGFGFDEARLKMLELILRSETNLRFIRESDTKTIFQHTQETIEQLLIHEAAAKRSARAIGTAYNEARIKLYKQANRALVHYKILWNHLHRNFCLPKEIVEHILTFVDFNLTPCTTLSANINTRMTPWWKRWWTQVTLVIYPLLQKI